MSDPRLSKAQLGDEHDVERDGLTSLLDDLRVDLLRLTVVVEFSVVEVVEVVAECRLVDCLPGDLLLAGLLDPPVGLPPGPPLPLGAPPPGLAVPSPPDPVLQLSYPGEGAPDGVLGLAGRRG